MNNQFFGDERDFFKYALLRILAACGLPVGVCWLLTEGCRKGGSKINYLCGGELRHMDSVLFDFLRDCVCVKGRRDVSILEQSGIIPGAKFFNAIFPCDTIGQDGFFKDMIESFSGCGLIFFDPDIGVLVPGKGPSKNNYADEYIRWKYLQAVEKKLESSLMFFQFFYPQAKREDVEKRQKEIFRLLREMGGENDAVFALWKRPVAYYFLARSKHKALLLERAQNACDCLGFEMFDASAGD